jgi:putative ABC transport system permease protein
VILGSKLEDGASGAINALTPTHRERLTEPDSVIVDEGDMSRLGLVNGIGEYGEINGQKVKVVDLVKGYKSIAGPYVMCSLKTARSLMRLSTDQTIYLLARCFDRNKAPEVVERLRDRYERGLATDKKKDMSVFTASEFSSRTQMHWLLKTRAGLVIGYAAVLGLLVGAVVTSQTLYAATVASIRELAILRALGSPRWRMAAAVLMQSFWVGLLGVILAIPTIFATAKIADWLSIKVMLDNGLLGFVAAVTMLTALLAGLFALRSLRQIEPASLLR